MLLKTTSIPQRCCDNSADYGDMLDYVLWVKIYLMVVIDKYIPRRMFCFLCFIEAFGLFQSGDIQERIPLYVCRDKRFRPPQDIGVFLPSEYPQVNPNPQTKKAGAGKPVSLDKTWHSTDAKVIDNEIQRVRHTYCGITWRDTCPTARCSAHNVVLPTAMGFNFSSWKSILLRGESSPRCYCQRPGDSSPNAFRRAAHPIRDGTAEQLAIV